MSSGWERCESDWWGVIAEQLTGEWPREAAMQDLRYWRGLELRGQPRPSLRELAERWGWFSRTGKPAVKRVRTLISGGEWEDPRSATPYQDPKGHGKGTVRARQGHGEGTPETDEPTESERQGHGKGTVRARQGHAKGTTRVVDTLHPSPFTLHPDHDPADDPTVLLPDPDPPPPVPATAEARAFLALARRMATEPPKAKRWAVKAARDLDWFARLLAEPDFQGLAVADEIQRMGDWLDDQLAKPGGGKAPRNWKTFTRNWFKRAARRSGGGGPGPAANGPTTPAPDAPPDFAAQVARRVLELPSDRRDWFPEDEAATDATNRALQRLPDGRKTFDPDRLQYMPAPRRAALFREFNATAAEHWTRHPARKRSA